MRGIQKSVITQKKEKILNEMQIVQFIVGSKSLHCFINLYTYSSFTISWIQLLIKYGVSLGQEPSELIN